MNDKHEQLLSSPEHEHIEARVARHSALLAVLSREVKELDQAVKSGFEQVFMRMDRQAENYNRSRDFNWGWFISGVSLLLLIGTLVVGSLMRDIGYVRDDLKHFSNEYTIHDSDGHPQAVLQRMASLEQLLSVQVAAFDRRLDTIAAQFTDSIDDLDTMTQRETRLLDSLLQREVKLSNESIRAELDGLSRRLDGIDADVRAIQIQDAQAHQLQRN